MVERKVHQKDKRKSMAKDSMFKGSNGAGKGDEPRPMTISKKEYDKRYEKIFGKKDGKKNIK